MTELADDVDGCQVALDATSGYIDDELLALVVLFAGVADAELERTAEYWRGLADA